MSVFLPISFITLHDLTECHNKENAIWQCRYPSVFYLSVIYTYLDGGDGEENILDGEEGEIQLGIHQEI